MRTSDRKTSIYTLLLRLLLLSAFAAVIAFLGLDRAGEYIINKYFEETDYYESKNQEYIEKFQDYINQNRISSRDTKALKAWLNEQKILYIKIYKDDIQIFDSNYPDQEIWEEEISAGNYEWESYYIVEFNDGTAEVIVTGAYSYQFYNYALIAEMCASFALFVFLVLIGIRRKMAYIRKLSSEIEILEGGVLDYPITVTGNDELSELADGLDSMRISFRNLIRQKAEIAQKNQRTVTEMSHDLRTPITSIMLYTEILKKEKYKNTEQLMKYLDKIEQKAQCMKHIADHLFEYSLISSEKEDILEEPEQYKLLFYDLLSETCSYLEQKGFVVKFNVSWTNCLLRVSTEYVMRILDNIISNILKYADISESITVSSADESNMIGFRFENKVRQMKEKAASSGIGIQSIKNMMEQMDGKCLVGKSKYFFSITFLFPKHNKS